MQDLLNSINEEFTSFVSNAQSQIEKGNKAAGARARKNTLALEKLLKEFRKVSLEAAKA